MWGNYLWYMIRGQFFFMGVEVRNRTFIGVTVAGGNWSLPRVCFLLPIFLITALALAACSAPDSAQQTSPPPTAADAATSSPSAMDTFRALAPPEGLKITALFGEKAKNDDARMQRLEDAVQGLRNDFDTVVPSLVRLVAVEKDMKDLVGQLQSLTDQVPAAPVDPVASQPEIPGGDATGSTQTVTADKAATGTPATSPPVTPEAASSGQLPPEGAASPNSHAPPPVVTPPAPVAQKPVETPRESQPEPKLEAPVIKSPPLMGVKKVRVADHKDKTRIVIDLTAKVDFKATLENKGKTLAIEIQGMDMSAIKPFEADSAALVSGWHVERQVLKFDLLYTATIKAQELLTPNGTPYYRLFVDLFSAEVP